MSKYGEGKAIDLFALGIATIVGFVLGLVLFGVLYAWYLSGFADSTSVLTTAIILIIIIYVVWYVFVIWAKKYGYTYQRALWLGIGFTIALIIVSLLVGWLGLSASVSVSALAYKKPMWIKS